MSNTKPVFVIARHIAMLMFVLMCTLQAQTFEVISVSGVAKIQRINKNNLEKVSAKSPITDNEILETGSQSRCIIKLDGATITAGANSRILFNVNDKGNNGSASHEINLTVFSGGCNVQTAGNTHCSLFSSSAVTETSDGTFSITVQPQTGQTDIVSFSGSISARAISQKNSIALVAGQTTSIGTTGNFSAPAYITEKKIAVLNPIFGDTLIQQQLSAAGIIPTTDLSLGKTSSSSDNETWNQYTQSFGLKTYKRLFSPNTIYGAILSDEQANYLYKPLEPVNTWDDAGFIVEVRTSFSMVNSAVYPSFEAVASYGTEIFNAGIKVPILSNYTKNIGVYGLNSLNGLLDKIDHITLASPNRAFLFNAGLINNLTIANGLVVNKFSNANPYLTFQPLGLYAKGTGQNFTAEAFLGDVSEVSPMGVHLSFSPGNIYVGAGYYHDSNKFNAVSPTDNNHFIKLKESARNSDSTFGVSIYEVNAYANLTNSADVSLLAGIDFSHGIGSLQGFTAELPSISLGWHQKMLKGGFFIEKGQMIMGQFHSYYMTSRLRIDSTSSENILTTQNSVLSNKRLAEGVQLFFGYNPHPGMAFETSIKQYFKDVKSFVSDTNDQPAHTDFMISLTVNDSLVNFLRYGDLYIRQEHAGLFPQSSSWFSSWGFSCGASMITVPVIYGIGLNAGFSFSFLDMNFNNRVDSEDGLFRLSIGFSRTF
jgi:hypothetical protein